MSKRPAEEQLTKETASADGTAEPSFTLYGDANTSTSTQRVLLTALELGLTYDLRQLSCINGVDTKTAEYLAINPYGRVPAALMDGVTLYESRAIARLLADKFQSKASPLTPTDFRGRALFEQVNATHHALHAPHSAAHHAPIECPAQTAAGADCITDDCVLCAVAECSSGRRWR